MMQNISLRDFEAIRQQAQVRNSMQSRVSAGSQSGYSSVAAGDSWQKLLESKRKELDFGDQKAQGVRNKSRYNEEKGKLEVASAEKVGKLLKSAGEIANSYISGSGQVNNVSLEEKPIRRMLGNYVDLMA